MSRAKVAKWVLMCGATAFIASAAMPDAEPMDDPASSVFELLGDNEMPNRIFNDLLEIAGDVASFLIRMVPGI